MFQLPSDFLTYTILLIVFALFQASLLIVLIYLFIDKVLITKNDDLDEEVEKQHIYDQALGILEDAKSQAIGLIQVTQQKVTEMLSTSESLSEESKAKLFEELAKLNQRQMTELESISTALEPTLKQALEQQRDTGVSEIQKTTQIVQQDLREGLSGLKSTFEKETLDAEHEAKELIAQQFEDAKKEILAYKEAKFSEINTKIYELIPQLTKEILGKAMTLNDHEALVLKILDDAKKEKTFEI